MQANIIKIEPDVQITAGKFEFNNFEKLKKDFESIKMAEVDEANEDTIKKLKDSRALCNKLKEALNRRRIDLKNEFDVPYNEFKAQVDELTAIADNKSKEIDKAVKAYEDAQKAKRKIEVDVIIDELLEGRVIAGIFDLKEFLSIPKLTNKDMTDTKVRRHVVSEIDRIESEYKLFCDEDAAKFITIEYQKHFNLVSAMSSGRAQYSNAMRILNVQENVKPEITGPVTVTKAVKPDSVVVAYDLKINCTPEQMKEIVSTLVSMKVSYEL